MDNLIRNIILLTLACLCLGTKKSSAQTGNLVYNGNFEAWDSTRYPIADDGNTDLCINSIGNQDNEGYLAWCLKGMGYCKWPPKSLGYDALAYKVATRMSVGGQLPSAIYCCYPLNFYQDIFSRVLPINGKTFISMNVWYDSVKNAYGNYNWYLSLPLTKSLVNGATYQVDFDLTTAMSPGPACDIDTADYNGCKGFGIGFTVDTPNYVHKDLTTQITNLQPKIKLGFFGSEKWEHFTLSFTADSAYKFVVIGFFNEGKDLGIYSHTPNCQEVATPSFPDAKVATFIMDNLSVMPLHRKFLPDDTTVCTGKNVKIVSSDGMKTKWWVNGQQLTDSGSSIELTITADNTVIAESGLATDTMQINASPYPVFNVVQTDTLCNEMTAFSATPDTYEYTWQPDDIKGDKVQLEGNKPRQVIASNAYNCRDTVTITPELGDEICGKYYIPNAFSPNEDSINSVFRVDGIGIIEVNMTIYNRWGEKLFQQRGDKSIGWNGSVNGNGEATQGIYIYIINITYFERKGVVKTEEVHGIVSLLK